MINKQRRNAYRVCNLLRHQNLNPMKYTMYFIKKKRTGIFTATAWLFKNVKNHFVILTEPRNGRGKWTVGSAVA